MEYRFVRQNGGMGEDDDEDDVAEDAHQGDHRIDTTVKHIVNDVVACVVYHCFLCGPLIQAIL